MSNMISYRDGYFFEIQDRQLMHRGPLLLTSAQLSAIEHVQQVYTWLLAELGPGRPATRSGRQRQDDDLAQELALMLGAELLITPEHRPLIRLAAA